MELDNIVHGFVKSYNSNRWTYYLGISLLLSDYSYENYML